MKSDSRKERPHVLGGAKGNARGARYRLNRSRFALTGSFEVRPTVIFFTSALIAASSLSACSCAHAEDVRSQAFERFFSDSIALSARTDPTSLKPTSRSCCVATGFSCSLFSFFTASIAALRAALTSFFARALPAMFANLQVLGITSCNPVCTLYANVQSASLANASARQNHRFDVDQTRPHVEQIEIFLVTNLFTHQCSRAFSCMHKRCKRVTIRAVFHHVESVRDD